LKYLRELKVYKLVKSPSGRESALNKTDRLDCLVGLPALFCVCYMRLLYKSGFLWLKIIVETRSFLVSSWLCGYKELYRMPNMHRYLRKKIVESRFIGEKSFRKRERIKQNFQA
jgi:hypothetical protein